ncbi:MAG: tetratricopeptide (TPR) repeat protein, partial [Pseudohongiellaceae bacterium]
MSKPRWIDGGVFKTLRSATRKRSLAVFVGAGHGTAEISSRKQLKQALGDGDRATLKDDPRCHSEVDSGLTALFTLLQPGIITTGVSDALQVSKPAEVEDEPRLFGPNSKGLVSAFDRKDLFLARLRGAADAPDTLVLTNKDRKVLTKQDSRYQSFLKAAFGRTVLFTGFALDDPDLVELLDDVGRAFNGHVPQNIALVAAGSSDPSAALRASVHYGTVVIEYPKDMTAAKALTDLAQVLEELEVPKPATGNPPRGFDELTAAFRAAVGDADKGRFLRGDASGWEPAKASLDVTREAAAGIAEQLLGDAPEDGKSLTVLVRGRPGEGKTTLARRVAWDLAEQGMRVFWLAPGVGVPDDYVPAEADDFRAVFVMDDASELPNLPQLLGSQATAAHGKARFLIVADSAAWERSGLDHRIRQHVTIRDVELAGLSAGEAGAMAAGLAGQSALADGVDESAAAGSLQAPGQVLMEGLSLATNGASLVEALKGFVAGLEADSPAQKALLAIALVHGHGMLLGKAHLAAVLGADDAALAGALAPLSDCVTEQDGTTVRTMHPLVAQALMVELASDEAVLHEMVTSLLKTLPGESSEIANVFHLPSELIRAVRQAPLPPLTLASFFKAGEEAARNDVRFWFDRGRSEVDFSRWAAALTSFDQALRRQPGDSSEREHNAVVQANRARCLEALGRKKEALSAVDEGLRASPQDAALLRLAEKLGGRRRQGQGGQGGRGGASR